MTSTVETPTFGRLEVWPGAAIWQQRDPTLDVGGLDLLVQGLLVSPSAQWEVSFALEDDRRTS